MIDFLYVTGTVAFFALMLGYLRVCERLGCPAAADTGRGDTRSEGSPS
jgi:hypothetical protein